jgi:4-amino-4-deoxy-L-arabinose transferase-like glycosyltransferase
MPDRARTGVPLIHIVVFAAVALPYFVNLGASSLWDSNESFYAVTPLEMIQSGDFLAPTFNSQPRAQKPPLTYWPIALCYRLFGVSEFSVRLPGAFAAAGLMLFVYLTGRLLFSPRAALISIVLTGTTMRIFLLARKLPIDILLLFFLAGTGYFVIRGIERDSTRDWLAAYALAALGFLTKGPVAVVIPFGACVVWSLWSGSPGFRKMRLARGILLFSVLVLPWYVLVYLHSGWVYIAPFLVRDNLGRFATEGLGPSRGPFYYAGVFLAEFFPWSILSVAALAQLWRVRKTLDLRHNLAWGFPLTWSLLVFAFFTASQNKQEYYIAPMYPMMALVLAAALDLSLASAEDAAVATWRKIWRPSLSVIAVLLLFGGLSLPFLIGAVIPGAGAVLKFGPTIVLLACVAALVWKIAWRRPADCVALLLVCWWFLLLAVPALYLPAFEPFRPIRSLCADLKPMLSPGDEVGYYRAAAPSMLFYLRRPIFEEWKSEKMVRIFQSSKRVFCVMSEADRDFFVGSRRLVLHVLDRRPQPVSRFRDIRDAKSRIGRELVLVSNQPLDLGAAAGRREAP